MIAALGEALDTSQDRVLVIDDGSPDGTGEIADRLAVGAFVGLRAPPRRRRRGSAPRMSRGSVKRSRKVQSSSSRWTATSPTTPPTSRGSSRLRRTPISCSDRATRRGWDGELGSRTTVRLSRRLPLRAGHPRDAGSRPHGRVQVLPAPDARGHRPRRLVGARLCVPDRDDLPREAGRPARPGGPDHVRRATRRCVEDDRLDRRRGDVAVPFLRLRALVGKL